MSLRGCEVGTILTEFNKTLIVHTWQREQSQSNTTWELTNEEIPAAGFEKPELHVQNQVSRL